MTLTRRGFGAHLGATVLGLAAGPVAGPVAAQAAPLIPLNALSAYMNGLTTVRTRFTQVTEGGGRAAGTLWIKRPGRLRFEYDPPEAAMVIAGGGALAIFDPRSDEPTRYPLRSTPLSIILRRNVDLAAADMVTAHRSEGAATLVRAQDPENLEYGYIDLIFSADPVALRQWVITDGEGLRTTVQLGVLEEGLRLPERLFNISTETRLWGK